MLTGGYRLYGVPDDFGDYLRADDAAFEIIPIDSAQDFFCDQGGQFFNLSILTHLPYSAAIGAKINPQLSGQAHRLTKILLRNGQNYSELLRIFSFVVLGR